MWLEVLEIILDFPTFVRVLPWTIGLVLGVLAIATSWARWAFAVWVVGMALFYWFRTRDGKATPEGRGPPTVH